MGGVSFRNAKDAIGGVQTYNGKNDVIVFV